MFSPPELKALVSLNKQVLEKLDDLDSRVNHSNETLDMINQNLGKIVTLLYAIEQATAP